MFEILKARRARRAAIRYIEPLVAGTRFRLNGIPDRAWCDPYVVGFLSMLITHVAERRVWGLGDEALGLVQTEAFAAIAGLPADSVGQQIFWLSAAGHHRFELGRQNALVFAVDAGASGETPDEPLATGARRVELWIVCFDRHLTPA